MSSQLFFKTEIFNVLSLKASNLQSPFFQTNRMISDRVMDQQEWINRVVRTFSAVTGDSASVVLRGKWGWWNHLRCLLLLSNHTCFPRLRRHVIYCWARIASSSSRFARYTTLHTVHPNTGLSFQLITSRTKTFSWRDVFFTLLYILAESRKIEASSEHFFKATIWTLNALICNHIRS